MNWQKHMRENQTNMEKKGDFMEHLHGYFCCKVLPDGRIDRVKTKLFVATGTLQCSDEQ